MVKLKVMDWGTGNLDSACMCNKTLEPDLHLFTLSKILFDEI